MEIGKSPPTAQPSSALLEGANGICETVSKDIPWTVANTLKPVRNVIIVPQGTGLRF